MKKYLAILLAFVLALFLTACGGNEEPPSGNNENPSSSQQQEQPSSSQQQEQTGHTPNEGENTKFGLSLEALQPECCIASEVEENTDSIYSVSFAISEVITEEFAFSYYKKVYDLTAGISEGGTNYKGSRVPTTNQEISPMGEWEDEHSAEVPMNTWFYKYNGEFYSVFISDETGYGHEINVRISIYS